MESPGFRAIFNVIKGEKKESKENPPTQHTLSNPSILNLPLPMTNNLEPICLTVDDLIQQLLPDLKEKPGGKTGPSLKEVWLKAGRKHWSEFEVEARKSFLEVKGNANVVLAYAPRSPAQVPLHLYNEQLLCGDESTVCGRFGQNIGHVMTALCTVTGQGLQALPWTSQYRKKVSLRECFLYIVRKACEDSVADNNTPEQKWIVKVKVPKNAMTGSFDSIPTSNPPSQSSQSSQLTETERIMSSPEDQPRGGTSE
ncbi:hypothetical protein T310_3500 [Rasamsonia emersonii CBS 393.64]|uniref:Uncharacterized protein n=1 Tax=Rasamsonia emersonii (strain ATCC 16479 / CBS 393.64 / IMI 116815) TaxID=1408163 RepID=A0A0F4YX41_RASE3|nr:hypothetical protein T310_3500 [Rasamsonia emersonii CBS 393.64]KKA22421.1 hypothetical protein T310_3500 [Rasamsonia emersonii CBS 393.64]